MASPLGWFRRHQKGMLVVFGCLLMAAFGLAGVMSNLTPRGSRDSSQNTPVVQWSGGTLTSGDLSNMRFRHFRAMNFLQQLQQNMVEQRGSSYQPRARMLTPVNDRLPPQALDREMMQRVLALQLADEIGIQISDTAVMRYLRNLADDQNLTHYDMDQFCARMFNNRTDFIVIREQLKQELAIEQVNQMSNSGIPFLPSITEAWEDFRKLETRVECEVMGWPVEDFISQVTESPGNSELRNLYEEGKYRYPDAAGEKPGFKRPRKMAVTALTANYNDFLERAKLAITPEQIQTEYDRLVALGDPLVMEIVPDEPTDDNMSGEDPPPWLDEALAPEDDADSGESESGDTPNDGIEPGEQTPDTGDDNDDGTENENNNDSGDEDDDSGLLNPVSLTGKIKIIPVSVQEETGDTEDQDEDPAEPTDNSADQDSADQDSADQDSADQDSADQDSADQDSADEMPATEQTDDQSSDLDELPVPVQPPAAPTLTPGENPLASNQDSLIQTRVRPLDDYLSDAIRGRLAGKPAVDAMDKAITEASADISDYGVDYEMWQQTKDAAPADREPEPDPLDPAAVAAKYKLNHQHAELSSQTEFAESDIGKISVAFQEQSMFGIRNRAVPLSDMLFARYYSTEPFRPETFEESFQPNMHLVFVEAKKDPEIPEFVDARDEIESYWKRDRALELATTAAASVAEQLNSSGKQLTEQNPAEAKNTGEFTWHTQTRLYPVLPGNIQPGEEFMETAFGTEIGKAGVAPDALRENVYVIQPITADQREKDDIENLFFDSLSANQGVGAGLNQLQRVRIDRMSRDWFEKLEDQYDVKWLAH